MPVRNFSPAVALVLTLVLALVLAVGSVGCGGQVSSGAGEGSIAQEFDLSGPQDSARFIVGSKDFTEQRVLGEISVQALEAAGADVTARIGLGGNEAVRQALISDEIDMYWEYTGTGWLVHLGNLDPIADPQEQYEAVAEEDLEENNVEWLDRAPGNNTYAIAASQETVEQTGVQNISDLARLVQENPEQATLCYGNENDFSSRADGLPGLEEAYDFEYPEDGQVVVPLDSVYENVAQGDRCDFGVVFTTSPLIEENNLQLLEDDENFFAVYNPTMILDEETLNEYPQLEDLFAPISEELTTETLMELNAAVDIEGNTPANVAEQWLRENGFIE